MISRVEIRRKGDGQTEAYIIDYGSYVDNLPEGITRSTIKNVIDKACDFLIPKKS
ncbi:MAG: hypothetical protein QXQ11_07665 [Candidatus Bathyarchaeia archaeon]